VHIVKQQLLKMVFIRVFVWGKLATNKFGVGQLSLSFPCPKWGQFVQLDSTPPTSTASTTPLSRREVTPVGVVRSSIDSD